MSFKLGDKVKDLVTGFEGVAIAKTTWLHGCDRYVVQGPLDKDGKVPEAQNFDEKQLVLVTRDVVRSEAAKPSPTKTGGPRNDRAANRR